MAIVNGKVYRSKGVALPWLEVPALIRKEAAKAEARLVARYEVRGAFKAIGAALLSGEAMRTKAELEAELARIVAELASDTPREMYILTSLEAAQDTLSWVLGLRDPEPMRILEKS